MTPNAESDLVARCRQGDACAWDELFGQHYAAVGRFVFQLSPDLTREDVEEVCQETFLAVIRRIGDFHGASQLQTWLFRIAANKAHDYLERRRAAKRGGGQTPLPLQADNSENGLAIDPPSGMPGPDAMLLNAERGALLREALEQLGDPCREIVELRYFGDLSYEEISAALGLNLKTVSSRLSKCLGRLGEIARAVFSGGKSTPFSV